MRNEIVKVLMEEKGISQKEMAEKMGLTESRVSQMLKKERDVLTSTLKKICEIIGCKAEDIW